MSDASSFRTRFRFFLRPPIALDYSLRKNRLEEFSRLKLHCSHSMNRVLWTAGQLLTAEKKPGSSFCVWELDVTCDRLALRYELLPASAEVNITGWCADGLRLITCDLSGIMVFNYSHEN